MGILTSNRPSREKYHLLRELPFFENEEGGTEYIYEGGINDKYATLQ